VLGPEILVFPAVDALVCRPENLPCHRPLELDREEVRGLHQPSVCTAQQLPQGLAARGETLGLLFCAATKEGRPTGAWKEESSIAYVLGRVTVRAGVPRASPHDFRWTFVGDLLDAGADSAMMQRLAGYADDDDVAP
jgi:hypothetical protein